MTLGIDVDVDPEDEDPDEDDDGGDFFADRERGPRDLRDIHVLECNCAALRVFDLCQMTVSPAGAVLGIASLEMESAMRLVGIDDSEHESTARAVRVMAAAQAAILNLRSKRQLDRQRARRR